MKVENQDDRKEMPEECDSCGSKVNLKRFEHYGPGYNVDWLCHYCTCDFSRGKNDVVKSVAAMLNVFEERIKSNIINHCFSR